MVLNTCFVLRRSSILHLAFLSAMLLPYILRWCYIILGNFHSCFVIHMLSRMRYFKSINLFVGVILVKISPKAFPKELLLWCLSMIQVISLSSWWKKFFISLVISIKSTVSINGRLSPHSLEMFSISPQQACAFRCG